MKITKNYNLTALLLLLIIVIIYFYTGSTTVQGGDNAEILTVAAGGGVLHPPSYPLYTLISQLFIKVPLGTLPQRLSILSSIFGVLTLAILYLMFLKMNINKIAANFTILLLAFSPLFWRYSTSGEVFSLALLIMISVIFYSYSIYTTNYIKKKDFIILSIILAAGISHHHTIIFISPIISMAFYKLITAKLPLNKKLIIVGVFLSGLSLGFLLYFTLFIPHGVWRFGGNFSIKLSSLIQIFMRDTYGGALPQQAENWLTTVVSYLKDIPNQFTVIGTIVGIIGILFMIKKIRYFGIAILFSWVLYGPFFQSLFDQVPEGDALVMLERFYSMPNLIFSFFIAFGINALAIFTKRTIYISILSLFIVLQINSSYEKGSHKNWTILNDYLKNTLNTVPNLSIIISSGDSDGFGYMYLQKIEKFHPDVATILPGLLSQDWYQIWLLKSWPWLKIDNKRLHTLNMEKNITTFVMDNIENYPIFFDINYINNKSQEYNKLNIKPFNAILAKSYINNTFNLDEASQNTLNSISKLQMNSLPKNKYDIYHRWEGKFSIIPATTLFYLGKEYQDRGDTGKAKNLYLLAHIAQKPWRIKQKQ